MNRVRWTISPYFSFGGNDEVIEYRRAGRDGRDHDASRGRVLRGCAQAGWRDRGQDRGLQERLWEACVDEMAAAARRGQFCGFPGGGDQVSDVLGFFL